jgi:hypothetical protein
MKRVLAKGLLYTNSRLAAAQESVLVVVMKSSPQAACPVDTWKMAGTAR